MNAALNCWLNVHRMHVKCIYTNNYIKLIKLSLLLSASMITVPFVWISSCSIMSYVVFNALQELSVISVILCRKLVETLLTKSCIVLWRSLKLFTLIWIMTEMFLVSLKIKINYIENLCSERLSKFKFKWNIFLKI